MSKLAHLSPSLLQTAARCMMQVFYFHVEKLKLPPGIARGAGTALHRVCLDIDQRSRIDTGTYRPIDELQQVYHDDLVALVKEVPDNDDEVQRLGSKEKVYGEYSSHGLKLLGKYNEDRDVLSGRDVEKELLVPFADTTLKGRLDVDVDDASFKDLKTKDLSKPRARRAGVGDVENRKQFEAYAAAKARLSRGDNNTAIVAEGEGVVSGSAVYFYKAEKPQIETLSANFDQESHKRIEEYAYRVNKLIEHDVYLPVDKGSLDGKWICTEKFCGAFSICPFGSKNRKTA